MILPFVGAFELPKTCFLSHPYSCFFSSAQTAEIANDSSTHFCLPSPDSKENTNEFKVINITAVRL